MSNISRCFFSLLCDALWQDCYALPESLNETETEQLLEIAKQQAVSGLVLDALVRNNVRIPKQYLGKVLGRQKTIKQNCEVVNKGVVSLNQLFRNYGIKYVVVKGQAVASYYPEPILRQAGDVDYYCDSSNFARSIQIIKDSWGLEAEREKSHYHVHFKYNGVTFEGHFMLATLYNKRKDSRWQQILDNDEGAAVNVGGILINTLSPTLHVFYIFLHLYNHLIALGIGLRQFCDMAVMLYHARQEIDMNVLRGYLHEFGLEKAYRACGSILVDYLCMPEESLGYCLSDTDRKYGNKILKVVFYRGNMGHYNKRSGFKGWKHKIESTFIKFSHFIKFMPLAPSFSCGWLWYEIKRSV